LINIVLIFVGMMVEIHIQALH